MTEPASSSMGAPTGTSGTPFRRVLIGTDFSGTADHALAVARLRFPDALRRLVHVTDARVTATPDLMGGVTPAALDPSLLHTLEEEGSQRLRTLAGPDEEAELLVGDPVTGLLEAAEHWGAELIVVGTHSKGTLEHFFVGSSAEKLVARSPVPVLTVRLPGERR